MRAIKPADEDEIKPADEDARPADEDALPTILRASILGMLATAALLGVVSATAGLGVAGWIAGLATGSAATALLVTARMRSDQPAILPADWITLTRALLIAGVAGLVADSFQPAGVDHSAGHPVRRRAGPRRGGRAGGALDRHRHPAGRPNRRRGRRVPHPAAQHRRVPGLRPLGAAHRRRPLRAAAGGLADPVAGRPVAAPVLAQSRGRGPGHRAHRCRIRSTQPPGRDDRGRRRAAVAGRVVRPRRDLAVPHRRQPARPPGSADRHRRAGAHGPVDRPSGARPSLAVLPRRFYPHPGGSAGPGCCRAGAAAPATTDRRHYRRNPLRPAHCRQDPQHSVLRGARSGVQPGE